MTVEVTELDPWTEGSEWDRYVERSPGATPFHRSEALRLQARHTGTTVTTLAGFKGREVVGLFPVFEYRKGPVSAALSPAPRSWVGPLGPVLLNVEKLKRRKTDRRNRQFLEACLDRIDAEISPQYSRFAIGTYEDVRPFTWNDFDVTTDYTYVVSLETTAADLLERFSSDARQNIRNAPEDGYEVTEGSADDVERIVDQVRQRYEDQGKPFQLDATFARELYEALPQGCIRPYVCRTDGRFRGGILVTESATTRFRWLGGVKPDGADVAVNDLLDWHVMRDGIEANLDRYDLVGAGVPSINRYKAKFDPDLEPTYTVSRGTPGFTHLVSAYRTIS